MTGEERTIHRLEAFSDIVIGFSLAQLGVSLLRRTDGGTVIDVAGILAFLFAFGIICSLWFFHHRLFAALFKPKTLPMLLNFAWLAGVVMLVVVAQKVAENWSDARIDEMYFGLYAFSYGILAVQAAIGLRDGADLSQEQRLGGERQLAFMRYWAIVFAVCFAIVAFLPPAAFAGDLISATFAAAGAGSFVIGRILRRRAVPTT
ncbi:MAG TPA: TMEM175 family protein [Candidatus Baltobacteraceae bacterium]|nr:TMEM175 family protein [Candidatus Baltobacteraceae bacterium]